METGIIILAAGNSSRLGRPKQLLDYKGKRLLDIVIQEAVDSKCRPILVVLGAYAEEIGAQGQHPEIETILNENWKEGIGSSICLGLGTLLNQQETITRVIIAVADQPFINTQVFHDLIETQQKTNKAIVASRYAQTIGTPVLFCKQYFEALLSLKGSYGAKCIIEQHSEDMTTISFESGKIDIDTEQDYQHLTSHT